MTTVADVGDIPTGVPLPQLPAFGDLSVSLVTGALAIAAIVLVQGSGVAESSPNLDGSRSDPNRDFIAQGVANVAAGLFQGQPVGGSVGQTALNTSSGAATRWAAVISGVWVLVILLVFSGAVGEVVMSSLAAVLIYAASRSIRVAQIKVVWRSGINSQIAVCITFVATLLLPIAAAVGLGVIVSLLLQLNQGISDLRVVELRRRDDGRFEERPAPAVTPDRHVLVIDAYGSLLYAGARTLQIRLPDPAGRDATGGRAATSRAALARCDVRRGALRLRRATRTRRRPSGSQRRAEPRARQDRTHLHPAGGGRHRGLRGERGHRRVDACWRSRPVSVGLPSTRRRRTSENDDGATSDDEPDVTPS